MTYTFSDLEEVKRSPQLARYMILMGQILDRDQTKYYNPKLCG